MPDVEIHLTDQMRRYFEKKEQHQAADAASDALPLDEREEFDEADEEGERLLGALCSSLERALRQPDQAAETVDAASVASGIDVARSVDLGGLRARCVAQLGQERFDRAFRFLQSAQEDEEGFERQLVQLLGSDIELIRNIGILVARDHDSDC